MKKYVFKKAGTLIIVMFLIGALFVTCVNAINVKDKTETNDNNLMTWTQTVMFSSPKITEKDDEVTIELDDIDTYTTTPGQPVLPYKSIVSTFPLGTKINDVTCTYSEPEKIELNKPIEYASQVNWYCSKNTPNNNLIIPPVEENIPWCTYHLGGGIDNGEHVTFLSIHIFPVKYDKDKSILECIDEITINVDYELPIEKPTSKTDYSLVIITPIKFLFPLIKLVIHKNNIGISTKLVTLSDIYFNKYFPVKGHDRAEKIKYFIKNSHEEWGSNYYLLVGGINRLPMRNSWLGGMGLLTDMYYADLYSADGSFCSWDSNGNHKYGENYRGEGEDLVDLYPDVYVGRLACNNKLEVTTVVDKIIKYESIPRGDWWDSIILLGGDTFPGNGVYEGEVTNDCIADVLPGFNHVKLWTSEQTFTIENINNKVSKGARFVEYSGHGYQYGMGTSPPNEQDRIDYLTLDFLSVSNLYKLPVVFFDACLTAKIDYTLGQALGIPGILNFQFPVYAWYWVKKIGGGAIATIGATDVAFTSVDEDGPQAGAGYLCLNFFKGYSRCVTVSEMLVYSQNYYLNNLWKDYLTIEQFILLGDPTLMIGGNS